MLSHLDLTTLVLMYLLQWLDFILAQENVPQTISTSYADDEQTGQSAYLQFSLKDPNTIAPQFRSASPSALATVLLS